jgi:outer membrane protein
MTRSLFAGALALALTAPALAADAGSWAISLGAHSVDPTSDNGSLAGGALKVDVGSDWQPTITAEYFFTPNVGIEVLASAPFHHDIMLNGVKAGSTKHLPPTVSLQYHFDGKSVSPFVGIGVNYTWFFSEDTTGPLAGTDLSLGGSWGLAAHAGVDFKVSDNQAIRVDARWIDIDTNVQVNGADVGTVKIDPFVYGVAYVWTF